MGKEDNIKEVKITEEANTEEDKNKYIRDLPKGLNKETLKKIKTHINNSAVNKFTTKGIAGGLGLSRVTVQRYLKYLAVKNELEVIKEYGSVGRPKHFYKLPE